MTPKRRQLHRKEPEPQEIRDLFRELLRQPQTPFPTAGRKVAVPMTHGVYIIRDPLGVVAHVGRSVRGKRGLYQRLCNHLGGSSSFSRKHLSGDCAALRSGYTYQFLEIEDARKRALVEYLAAGSLCPAHLGLGGKAEV